MIAPPPKGPGVTRIISGGQTGADRGGLDAALALGLDHGGWCPRGRRAEDGAIPEKYLLRETTSKTYTDRTMRNVALADATVVFTWGPPEAGSDLTVKLAISQRKPWALIDLKACATPCLSLGSFLDEHRPRTLNVAGSCESQHTGTHTLQRLVAEVVASEVAEHNEHERRGATCRK